MSTAGPRSKAIFADAQTWMPGGVNSPVRAFRAVGGVPLVIQRGEGAYFYDEDQQKYLDFVCSWGPLIHGHAHPQIVAAVQRAAARGMTFGAPCAAEARLAKKVVEAYPGIEQVRFVSSGTEAAMSAIRLARGITGRDKVIKFSGCYHGHVDHLLVAAGSGLVTFGEPSSAGVPASFAEHTLVLPLDDEEALRETFRKHGDEIAVIAIEPIPANNGLLLQRQGFLQLLRDISREYGSLLLFDEVISGFRVARGGAAELLGITPDLAAFGKVIGGGMPVGAFGASRESMARLAPEGPVYQAGTLSGNPVAMAAGLESLNLMEQESGWSYLESLGQYLEEQLAPVLAAAPFPAQLVRLGSLFWMALQGGEAPRSAETIESQAGERYGKIFQGLLQRGVALAPSAYEVGFLSLAHDQSHIDQFRDALQDSLADMK